MFKKTISIYLSASHNVSKSMEFMFGDVQMNLDFKHLFHHFLESAEFDQLSMQTLAKFISCDQF